MNETAAATETNDDRPTTPDADAVAGQGDSSPDSTRDQRRKKSANRPAMQIYRPP
uniref:Uncharacterized protein n=1 Tax=Plectus sambesii TaxID=2011161 RepID=A0A914XH41_9BILA